LWNWSELFGSGVFAVSVTVSSFACSSASV